MITAELIRKLSTFPPETPVILRNNDIVEECDTVELTTAILYLGSDIATEVVKLSE